MNSSGGLDPPREQPHDPPQYGWETDYLDPLNVDDLEQRILEVLCREGRCHSSVVLTADLYGTTAEVEEYRPLEWTLVEQLLQDLNAKGLVTYRLGYFGAGATFGDVIVHIRPTQLAYKALGITRKWAVMIGAGWHNRQEQPIHPGDTTDFRSHGETAVGIGPTIHEDFIDHCIGCNPEHLDLHRDQLKEMFGTDDL